jgi:uncharacterized protein YukE
MKVWDLAGGMARIDMAAKTLTAETATVSQLWSDEANRAFVDRYIKSGQTRVRNLLDALRRLNEILAEAERQCSQP